MSEPPSDDALMAYAAQGREAAYVQLVERYQQGVRGFCRMMLRDQALAYDMAQEVFLKIWRRRAQYAARGRFKEFLYTVARNECRSVIRKRAVFEYLGWASQAEELPAADESMQNDYEERLRGVAAALCELPEQFRVPLTLRYVEGMQYAEIARVIGRSDSAARSRVFYGLKQLTAALPAEVLS